mmetsp:Transcript_20914/g.45592  ORF Transcript_20914/g.45592 Transcript_20914/m.45592 type:complete len:383 (-) Transcript_20914:2153-3301(-)
MPSSSSSSSPSSLPSSALSSTGLFPTSRRNEQDTLSSPENWKPLPPRPRPEVHRFRGDNVVNRRRQRRHNGSASDARGGHDVIGSRSMSIARPETSAAGSQGSEIQDENESKSHAEWDNSQWHSSSHRLDREEEERQADVRNRSLSHLRAMASRRKKLLAMQRRLEVEIRQEDREEDQEEQGEREETGEDVQIPSMKPELVDNDELSPTVEAAVNIPAPVQVRLHTPCKVAATSSMATATSMATAGFKGRQSPEEEKKRENQRWEEVEEKEEEVPSLHNFAAQVEKLESRLQNLGDNGSDSEEQQEDDVNESTTISAFCQQGKLLDDISSDEISTSSPSDIPRPPLQIRAESSELPGLLYHHDGEEENPFSEDIVGSILERH